MRRLGRALRRPVLPPAVPATVARTAARRCGTLARAGSESPPLVAVGISGGVDSAIAAQLLVEQGYRVVGLHVRSWDERDETGECAGEADRRDAQDVCRRLGIPLHDVDLVNEYWLDVFEPFLARLESGLTPNPDLPCNVHIKFGPMWEYAQQRLGADLLATGHYARLVDAGAAALDAGDVQLARAADETKDQSYFLATVPPRIWRNVLFPLGSMRKEQVRQLAESLGLRVASKKSSTGLCFVGKRRFGDFIGQYLVDRPGEIRCVDDGRRVGEHRGLWRYTLGQGARIGGSAQKYFVARKDMERRTLWVAPGRCHPAMFSGAASTFADITWASPDGRPPAVLRATGALRCRYKVRYSQSPLGWCDVELVDAAADEAHPSAGAERGSGAALRLVFHRPQRAVTPGQAVVLYGPALPVGGGQARADSTVDTRIIAAATIAGAEPLQRAAGHGAAVSDFVD